MDTLATTAEPPAIEMKAVAVASMRNRHALVLENVNWSVAAGDYWVVAGLHGSGKTDFLMMTAGLMPPAQGTYHLYGEEMPIFEGARLKCRLRLGLVFDGGLLFNQLTVAENVALPLRYHQNLTGAQARDEVGRILELTELTPWADSTPGALGRNWQKRVGLARALVLRPDVLLVDNPLGGLDLRHRFWWLSFLDRLAAGHECLGGRPATLVVAGDDLRPWTTHAQQFAVIKEKQFLTVGNRDQLAASQEPLVTELLAGAATSV